MSVKREMVNDARSRERLTEQQSHCQSWQQSTSLNEMQNSTELTVICAAAGEWVGEETSQPRVLNADSSGQVTKDRNNCIKMGDQENSKFQTTSFTNLRAYSVLTVKL